MQQIDCFLELLLYSVHVALGQPRRRLEITTIQHRNSILQDCNIFVVDRQVIIVVCYYKL